MIKPKHKLETVDSILTQITNPSTDYQITVTYTENGTTISHFIHSNDFLSALKFNFSYFHFVHVKTVADFKTYFDYWLLANQENLNRIYQALYHDYNPVENYDKYSDITATPNINGVDVETQNSNLIETSMTLTDKSVVKGNANLQSKSTEHTHGNIGVTEASTMITHEIEMRLHTNLCHAIVNSFARGEIIA